METYYFKQIDRDSGELLGYISYDGIYPTNTDPQINLVELAKETFREEARAIFTEEEE